jgi:DNA-binding NarL/FixJ family response regulator
MLPSIRILVVDDFEDWRRQVRLLLQARPEWEVIAEGSDGSEAIQKAEELKPDLIVLDIGLPKLNGIEAGHRIRQLSPSCKILFLSQNNDYDVVQAALGAGALGYVHKTKAREDLLPAVDAVLRGEQFVSGSLKSNGVTDTSVKETPHRHEVLFYLDDTVFLDRVTRFIATALESGNAAVALATKSHRDGLLQRLKAQGVDTGRVLQRGTYVSLDAAETLSTIMVNSLPDPVLFFGGVGGIIKAAAKAARSEGSQVVVLGEAAALLQKEGKADAAIRFEQFGNDLVKTHEVDILCAYPLSSFHREEDNYVFQNLCAEHSAVYSQ